MVGIVGMEVEGLLPLGINGGIVENVVVDVGPPIVGNKPTSKCVVGKISLGLGLVGQVEETPVMIGGMDISTLLTIPP